MMNKLVNCKLKIKSIIDNKIDVNVIEGKGYCKKDTYLVVYFTSNDIKYKYEYRDNELKIYCNDSQYCFKKGKNSFGKIKNGDYIFEITTFASKLEVNENCVLLNYELLQNNSLIGKYETSLFF